MINPTTSRTTYGDVTTPLVRFVVLLKVIFPLRAIFVHRLCYSDAALRKTEQPNIPNLLGIPYIPVYTLYNVQSIQNHRFGYVRHMFRCFKAEYLSRNIADLFRTNVCGIIGVDFIPQPLIVRYWLINHCIYSIFFNI